MSHFFALLSLLYHNPQPMKSKAKFLCVVNQYNLLTWEDAQHITAVEDMAAPVSSVTNFCVFPTSFVQCEV